MDVINKGILRMVRRFFHRLFTESNRDVVQKGFINFEFSELLQRMEELLSQIGFGDDTKNMAIFLLKIFRIAVKNPFEGDSGAFRDAEVVNDAMTQYSRTKYALVNRCKYFRMCIEFIYAGKLANSNVGCLSHLLETEAKCIKNDKEKYLETFKGLYSDIAKNSI